MTVAREDRSYGDVESEGMRDMCKNGEARMPQSSLCHLRQIPVNLLGKLN